MNVFKTVDSFVDDISLVDNMGFSVLGDVDDSSHISADFGGSVGKKEVVSTNSTHSASTHSANTHSAQDLLQFLSSLKNKRARVSFDSVDFIVHVEDVRLAKLSDMTNPPERRQHKDSDSFYRPKSILVKCREGNLFFVVEDILSKSVRLDCLNIVFEDFSVCIQLLD